MNKKYCYTLEGLACAACANKIETTISKKEGYENVVVNFNTSKLSFESNNQDVKSEIVNIVKSIEPDVNVLDNEIKNEYRINKINLIRIIIGILLGISTIIFDYNDILNITVLICSYLILLPRTFVKAVKILIRNKSLDENILITISVIGAFIIGDGFEGFMVIALYEIGKFLEELAVNKSKKSIKELMDIKPTFANLKVGNDIVVKDPNDIKIGDIIVIKSGEMIPLDGVVVSGSTFLDTKTLTGESKPKEVNIHDEVLSGSINISSLIEVKVSILYQDSTVSKILELVENATNRKAKTENFVSKIAKIYTPIIISIALASGLILPLITNLTYNESIYRALSFLVISCPCAIAISVPLSYFSGIGLASKKGILVKGSDYLDNLKNIKTIVFDKTGTLTTGTFKVNDIIILNENYTKEEILKICAIGESYSNHPIAKSIIEYYGKEIKDVSVKNYKEIAGKGITYELDNKKIQIGNNIQIDEKDEGTIVYVSIDNILVGKIIIKDEIKISSKPTIEKLNSMNIQTVIFTGDNKQVAKTIADELGIKKVYYELLPSDKYSKLENMLNERNNSNEKIAFVGDGINDAPVLTLADIGISMGMAGSSSAIEASDIVLMTDEVDKIVTAINVSKVTTKIIKQNLIFGIGIKLLFIILNIFGLSTMFFAVFADVGVTILAILNSIRILKN